ncbi:MAG: alanine racemase [Clostridia bacterium]|nr:alanine racemase [Clostridia bacterium]
MIRPVWVEVDLEAIRENIRQIRRLTGQGTKAPEIMAVVKAEAYGHGAVATARAALEAGATRLGVAIPEEGILLREAGIDRPVLVFTPLLPDQVETFLDYGLTATIAGEESARALSAAAGRRGQKSRVHLKVDTGMGRVGVSPAEAQDLARRVAALPNLEVEGVYSHFATADEADLSFAYHQLAVFKEVLNSLEEAGLKIPLRHIANSGAIINLPESYFDLVRAGIIIYGLYPSPETPRDRLPLKPALSLKARVVQVKRVPPGTGISYGQVYHTRCATNIVTLPLGYADGWSRLLSGKARVLLKGKSFPLAGRICMDQCMADVGDLAVEPGEEAVLIGKQGGEEISVDEVAGLLGTINYEVVCMLSGRVPRVWLHAQVGAGEKGEKKMKKDETG